MDDIIELFAAICLLGLVALCICDGNKKAELERLEEPQDRVDFQKFFDTPVLDAGVNGTDEQRLARKIMDAKVKATLLPLAQSGASLEKELAGLREVVDEHTDLNERKNRIASAEKNLNNLKAQFTREIHVADRFDYNSEYHEVYERLKYDQPTEWSWVVREIQSAGPSW